MTVTVGIAGTRTLAKLANHVVKNSKKTEGVLDLVDSPYKDVALARTPAEEIWGVGPAYSKLLKQRGIWTALPLRDTDTRRACRAMTVVGARIVMELRGVRCLPLGSRRSLSPALAPLAMPRRRSRDCARPSPSTRRSSARS